jgi:hypothetical protein
MGAKQDKEKKRKSTIIPPFFPFRALLPLRVPLYDEMIFPLLLSLEAWNIALLSMR